MRIPLPSAKCTALDEYNISLNTVIFPGCMCALCDLSVRCCERGRVMECGFVWKMRFFCADVSGSIFITFMRWMKILYVFMNRVYV